jgi:MATE family multidrug resistance protein
MFAAVFVIAAHLIYLRFAEPGPATEAFRGYIQIILWSLPGLFIYAVLQRYWQARHIVLPFTYLIIVANVLNLLACFAFGLGWWGFPRMEVKGIALATVCCRYVMVFGVVLFTWWKFRAITWRPPAYDAATQREIFRLGIPAAGHTGLEIGAFTTATIVVGSLGAVPLAAHHVSLMLAAFTFMFPLGFASSAAVRVGYHVGGRRTNHAGTAGWLCIGLSAAVMSLCALAYLLFPRVMLGWFSKDPAVLNLGARILAIVAIFQIADGVQISAAGALRGAGNTRSSMLANLIGHYPIGLALGLTLCFLTPLGVVGMWIGLAAGLMSVAVILLRVWAVTARDPGKLKPLAPGTPGIEAEQPNVAGPL